MFDHLVINTLFSVQIKCLKWLREDSLIEIGLMKWNFSLCNLYCLVVLINVGAILRTRFIHLLSNLTCTVVPLLERPPILQGEIYPDNKGWPLSRRTIELLHILDAILKLNIFIGIIFLTVAKGYMERTKNLNIIYF
jgi:hypothetical protein